MLKREPNFICTEDDEGAMGRKSPDFKARPRLPRPEWPYQFRELASFLFAPERWASARRILWSNDFETLRRDLLHWIYHFSGAPRVGPDGFRDVLPVGPVYRPKARNVLIAANSAQRGKNRPISELIGDPYAPYFPPVICEVAYNLAGRARGLARAELAQPGM